MPYKDPEKQRAFKRAWREKNAFKIAMQRRAERARDRENRAGLRNRAAKPQPTEPARVERYEPAPISLPVLNIPTLAEIEARYGALR